jgi:hypothetical protein
MPNMGLFVSLFHVLIGAVKGRISDLDDSKSPWENIEENLRIEFVLEQQKLWLKFQIVVPARGR